METHPKTHRCHDHVRDSQRDCAAGHACPRRQASRLISRDHYVRPKVFWSSEPPVKSELPRHHWAIYPNPISHPNDGSPVMELDRAAVIVLGEGRVAKDKGERIGQWRGSCSWDGGMPCSWRHQAAPCSKSKVTMRR